MFVMACRELSNLVGVKRSRVELELAHGHERFHKMYIDVNVLCLFTLGRAHQLREVKIDGILDGACNYQIAQDLSS